MSSSYLRDFTAQIIDADIAFFRREAHFRRFCTKLLALFSVNLALLPLLSPPLPISPLFSSAFSALSILRLLQSCTYSLLLRRLVHGDDSSVTPTLRSS